MGTFYVYINKNKVIFKFLHYDNNLSINTYNSYGHLLIYKLFVSDGLRKSKKPQLLINNYKKLVYQKKYGIK